VVNQSLINLNLENIQTNPTSTELSKALIFWKTYLFSVRSREEVLRL